MGEDENRDGDDFVYIHTLHYPVHRWLRPGKRLRFVEREGSRVLQQLWTAKVTVMEGGENVQYRKTKWRDVPLEVETGTGTES